MKDTEMKIKKLCEMKDRLVDWCSVAMVDDKADIDATGKVVDMIKDLCEAEKDLWKACYYHKVTEAMEKEKEMGEERYGYDNWRYSSGRFAPKGRGTRMGYDPDPRMWQDGPYEGMHDMERMGYADGNGGSSGMGQSGGRGNQGSSGSSSSSGGRSGYTDQYGSSYGRYRDSRRHYHESGAQSDKEEMGQHAKEYMSEAMGTFREIWKEADPEMKTKMKAEVSSLAKELGI